MFGCMKCSKISGVLFLVFGIVFLLEDLGLWTLGLSWYTIFFALIGIISIGNSMCKDCQAMMKGKK
ncbi:hypothetical protein HYX17_01025 [Candidatus Woesearchaeota archaeon]|nr:hypothetical protein [Candidatus Woesearchaeota archaeon]